MTFYDPYQSTPQAPAMIPLSDHMQLMREYEELKLKLERVTSTPAKMRRVFDYYGSKWSHAEWIVSRIPVHEVYVEPFLGSGGVFFTKPVSGREIISDLYGEIARFFRTLRSQPDELIRAIMLTPYAESEFDESKIIADNDLEAARRFYARMRMGWMGGGITGRTFRRDKTNARSESLPTIWRLIGSLYQVASRLQNAQIECADAFEQIERYDSPTTLFYIDPPYVASTRGAPDRYIHEMTDSDHERLATALHGCKGMVMISGYPSDLYNRLYADWAYADKAARDLLRNEQIERLWLSPSVMGEQRQKQMFELA